MTTAAPHPDPAGADAGALHRRMTPFGPGGAPRVGMRPWLAVVALVFALAMLPLMFADEAPVVLDHVSDSIENTFPDFYWHTLKPHFPRPDIAMHFMLFTVAGLLVGLLSWSWRTFVLGQIVVLGAGLATELLQPIFTSTRDIQEHDIVANALGQTTGMLIALAALWTWSLWESRRSAH